MMAWLVFDFRFAYVALKIYDITADCHRDRTRYVLELYPSPNELG